MKKLAIAIAFALPLSALLGGCKEDEAPPPLPSAAPEEEAPAESLQLVAEVVDVDAGTDAGPKKYGPAKPKGSLGACCAALTQNAANAPEPTATYMKQAAATCSMLVGQGQGQSVIGPAVSAALRGASLPSACK